MQITSQIALPLANRFRSVNFASIKFANYQIRAYGKNKFNVSENFVLFSPTEILYTNEKLMPIKTIYNVTASRPGYSVVEAIFTGANSTMVALIKPNDLMSKTYAFVFLQYDGNTTISH